MTWYKCFVSKQHIHVMCIFIRVNILNTFKHHMKYADHMQNSTADFMSMSQANSCTRFKCSGKTIKISLLSKKNEFDDYFLVVDANTVIQSNT